MNGPVKKQGSLVLRKQRKGRKKEKMKGLIKKT